MAGSAFLTTDDDGVDLGVADLAEGFLETTFASALATPFAAGFETVFAAAFGAGLETLAGGFFAGAGFLV